MTGINGESTSMVWPTLGSRTAKRTEQNRFYPRDAMLAQVLAMALCPSVCVCLSQAVVKLGVDPAGS